jgi:hypothetical protein
MTTHIEKLAKKERKKLLAAEPETAGPMEMQPPGKGMSRILAGTSRTPTQTILGAVSKRSD